MRSDHHSPHSIPPISILVVPSTAVTSKDVSIPPNLTDYCPFPCCSALAADDSASWVTFLNTGRTADISRRCSLIKSPLSMASSSISEMTGVLSGFPGDGPPSGTAYEPQLPPTDSRRKSDAVGSSNTPRSSGRKYFGMMYIRIGINMKMMTGKLDLSVNYTDRTEERNTHPTAAIVLVIANV